MDKQIQFDNHDDILAKYGYNIKVQLGRKVADELLFRNIDFRNTSFFNEKIKSNGHLSFTKSDCLNSLLDFYSILEISQISNFITPVRSSLRDEILNFMQEGNVKNYCFFIYRSVLPFQLLERLETQFNNELSKYSEFDLLMFYQFLMLYDFLEDSQSFKIFVKSSYKDKQKMFFKLKHDSNQVGGKYQKFEIIMLEGYFRYIEFLEMISDFFSETNEIPKLQFAVANFFILLIDQNRRIISNILKSTEGLYEHFVGDRITETNDESLYEYREKFMNFKMKLSLINKIVTQFQTPVYADNLLF